MKTQSNLDYEAENKRLRIAAWQLVEECYSGQGRCYRKPSEVMRDVLTGRDTDGAQAPAGSNQSRSKNERKIMQTTMPIPEFEDAEIHFSIALLPHEHRLGTKVRKTIKDGCILISYWSASWTSDCDMDTFATRIGSGELERFHGGMDAAQNDSIRRFFAHS